MSEDFNESKISENHKKYIEKRKKLSGFFFERALPNEYIIQIGKKNAKPILGGKRFKLFRRFLRIPAFVQTLYFKTDNANIDFQGIGIEGYAAWRINPEKPEIAINTLNFYNEEDPMAETNNQLRTICIEAVRHVIANMNIDDALKKKDEIAENLKQQLKPIQQRWGIVFDELGIESVRIMSDMLFEDLQSQYRDSLRLDVAKTRISTDKQIAAEENAMREKTELERISTDKNIEMANIENNTFVEESRMNEERKLSQQQIKIDEEEYLEKYKFRVVKENKEKEIQQLTKNIAINIEEINHRLLNLLLTSEEIESEISRKKTEIDKLRREVTQVYSKEALLYSFIESIPDIFDKIKIDNYSVMDYGGGKGISPIGKILTELFQILKNSDLKWLLDKKSTSDEEE